MMELSNRYFISTRMICETVASVRKHGGQSKFGLVSLLYPSTSHRASTQTIRVTLKLIVNIFEIYTFSLV